uniref:Laminin, gamma 2 n=1 Tax=Cynoglossus semilaevis TaxID=244447 RepID=A0A3P8WC86_CYNSE
SEGKCVCVCVCVWYHGVRCQCNGRSRYCLWDDKGLHCVDCQGNTEGRHCESCKAGFYQQVAGQSCVPCSCDPTGSVSNTCDSRGRCSCRDGVQGDKCNIQREDSGSQTPLCFCYGHSSSCSASSGYSAHNISSTFQHGTDGWTVASSHGVRPSDVHFRWSPSHGDLEVISKNSLPVYLYAPDQFLGNHLFSYGQNLSFSLRLDRGVRHPSTNDVILEGGGLKVSASLGDLRSIVPCGQKIHYSFRLDEQPSSRWRPQLSSLQFQTLLQNLTAIKIRATFGEKGRAYLDNVHLTSAQRSNGVPAAWVRTCICPKGYEGEFCQHCSAGFRRRVPADGAFSTCEPCNCSGGSCDQLTGDCYSADETHQDHSCAQGFYRDFWKICVKCPCPQGVSCFLPAGSLEPQCYHCPIGTTGPNCNICQEGYYGTPCRPCQCNGHIDISVAGSCDQQSGECLKCMNNTRGQHCEMCLNGFYHNRATDVCKPCNCDFHGSESRQCDDFGLCRCRAGFEGDRCQRLSCPSCFSPIKTQKNLQGRLSTISRGQLLEGQNLQNLDSDVDVLRLKQEKLNFVLLYFLLLSPPSPLTPLSVSSRHQGTADTVEETSDSALKDSEQSLVLVRALMNREQKVQKQITDLETLKDSLKKDLDQDVSDFEVLQDRVQRNVAAGHCTELMWFASGFDKQMNHSRALADVTIARLPEINATIQEAISDNTDTLSVLGNVGSDYNDALGLMGELQSLGMLGTLPPYGDLVSDATKLNTTAKELETEAADLSKTIKRETLNSKTLRKKYKPGATVDEDRLRQLEEALAKAQVEVDSSLRPRLQDMEQQENAMRRHLVAVNVDINNIQWDITNLEDILNTVPSGCFNSQPIEAP